MSRRSAVPNGEIRPLLAGGTRAGLPFEVQLAEAVGEAEGEVARVAVTAACGGVGGGLCKRAVAVAVEQVAEAEA